jgi:hypothetical protein
MLILIVACMRGEKILRDERARALIVKEMVKKIWDEGFESEVVVVFV